MTITIAIETFLLYERCCAEIKKQLFSQAAFEFCKIPSFLVLWNSYFLFSSSFLFSIVLVQVNSHIDILGIIY